MSTLIVSESAGFCFGVSRSLELAEKMLRESPRPCFSLGEIIHNPFVVEDLKSRGLTPVASAAEVPEGSSVIIRSHGVAKSELELLEGRDIDIIDAACPMVKRIHSLVSEADKQGSLTVIIGDETHAEVEAIRGWCADSVVFADADKFGAWQKGFEGKTLPPIRVVFQTTQTQKNLEATKKILKKEYTNAEIFDTICGATSKRQYDAAVLSEKCDAVVVIGSRTSANSLHLAEICGESCDNVLFISNADELDVSALAGADAIGITAGASTPEWIIKEVIKTMTDEIKIEEAVAEQEHKEAEPVEAAPAEDKPAEVQTEEAAPVEAEAPEGEKTFDQMLEDSIKTIYNGDTVTGIIAAITPTEISVDLGTKHSGYIPVSEFSDDAETNIEELVKIGEEIEAVVVRVNDVEGTVMLSKKRLDAVKNWSTVEEAAENGEILEGIVSEDNKGGVVVTVKGVRVFVPASQTGLPKEAEMSELKGQKVRLKITETNRGRRRVVGSIRQVQRDERRERSEKIWNDIEVGARYKGVVKSLTGYGAFVDIGGIDGMVHVSELSWSRIKQPSEVVKVGDEIEVYVIGFDRENRKISLGYKDPDGNPWSRFMTIFKVGDVTNVKIVKLMPFGAFAEVLPGVDGLIHISQIANRRIGKPDEVLTVGDSVEAKITAIDEDKQKISLSIRALLEPERPAPADAPAEDAPKAEPDALVYEVAADGTATGEAPAEAPAEETPVETPAETPAEEAPVETPAETPAEEAPVETPVEAPAEEVPVETPAETPAETPTEEAPAEAPAE